MIEATSERVRASAERRYLIERDVRILRQKVMQEVDMLASHRIAARLARISPVANVLYFIWLYET